MPSSSEKSPKSAGSIFLEAVQNSPKSQAAVMRAHARLKAFAEAVQYLRNDPEYLGTVSFDCRELAAQTAELREQFDNTWTELERLHLPIPESYDDWTKLALIAGIPRVEMETLSANDIYISALAWAERIKIKSKLLQDVRSDGDGEPEKPTSDLKNDAEPVTEREKPRAATATDPPHHKPDLAKREQTGRNSKKRKKAGRRPATAAEKQADADLAEAWEKAREAKVYKADFAREKSMTVKELDRVVSRVKRRETRSNK